MSTSTRANGLSFKKLIRNWEGWFVKNKYETGQCNTGCCFSENDNVCVQSINESILWKIYNIFLKCRRHFYNLQQKNRGMVFHVSCVVAFYCVSMYLFLMESLKTEVENINMQDQFQWDSLINIYIHEHTHTFFTSVL